MKKLNRYRFSLQWGTESADKIQVGEVLDKLGNKKSEFVVLAVSEYLKTHPEIPSDAQKINIIVRPSLTCEQIETMVKAIVYEHIAEITPVFEPVTVKTGTFSTADLPDESNINIMLKNLELFT